MGLFTSINIAATGMSAERLRSDVISNNIANADTPGYKRQDVDFEAQLSKALGKADVDNMEAKVASLRSRELEAKTHSDFSEYDYRLDENNVDIQVENVNLAKNQLKYNGLMTSVRMEFQNLINAMK